MLFFNFILLSCLFLSTNSFTRTFTRISDRINTRTSLNMEIKLYGSQSTRSPLVNWYLLEKNIPFKQLPPRPNNNPFGSVPFLTDGDIEIFESGAILLYLADAYGGNNTPQQRSTYTKWVVWANAELDRLCFGEGMRSTQLDKPSKALDTLEKFLQGKEWLVNNEFTVADVAVSSYLNYVPVFFGSTNPSARPNIVSYMARAASRPAFAKAFGDEHAEVVLSKTKAWSNSKSAGSFKLW